MLVNALANRRSALAVGYAEARRPTNRTRCRSFSCQERKLKAISFRPLTPQASERDNHLWRFDTVPYLA